MALWRRKAPEIVRVAAPAPEPPPAVVEPPPVPGYVLDLGGGAFEIVPGDVFDLNQRRKVISGVVWEHVGEDAHGRWIYRS